MPWAPEYATVDEIHDLIRIDDDADDAVIEAALSGASRAIDHACDPRPGHWRQFGRTDTPQDRWFTPSRRGYSAPWRDQWVAVTDDIASSSGVLVAAVALHALSLVPGIRGLAPWVPVAGGRAQEAVWPLCGLLAVLRVVRVRAERAAWAAYAEHGESMNIVAITYLNRLSDLLFILARDANREQGDVLWQPGGER